MAAAMEDTATGFEWLENGRGLRLFVRVWEPREGNLALRF